MMIKFRKIMKWGEKKMDENKEKNMTMEIKSQASCGGGIFPCAKECRAGASELSGWQMWTIEMKSQSKTQTA